MNMGNQINKTEVGVFFDSLVNTNYKLVKFDSAKGLSDLLKETYIKNGIDFNESNSISFSDRKLYGKDLTENQELLASPPKEIYEYQNFFLIENSNGEYTLLDGFRRLLFYTPYDNPILVRVYKKDELNEQQILSLLLYLNHFKMIGTSGGAYFDRGFALLLHSVFNLKIHPYSDAFNGYLSNDHTDPDENRYGLHRKSNYSKNLTIKDRIVNPFFISDLKFIQDLNSEGRYMVNEYFGTLVFQERLKTNTFFDVNLFKSLHDESKVLNKLMERFAIVGTRDSSDSIKVVRQIVEEYKNIFSKMNGEETKVTYAGKLAELKAINDQLKKDKTLFKFTRGGNSFLTDPILLNKYLTEGFKPIFKVVVYPVIDVFNGKYSKKDLSGVYDDFIFDTPKHEKKLFGGTEYIFDIHNESLRLSSKRKEVIGDSDLHKCDVYITNFKLDKEEVECEDKYRTLIKKHTVG